MIQRSWVHISSHPTLDGNGCNTVSHARSMNVPNPGSFLKKKIGNQMGHTKKNFLEKNTFKIFFRICFFNSIVSKFSSNKGLRRRQRNGLSRIVHKFAWKNWKKNCFSYFHGKKRYGSVEGKVNYFQRLLFFVGRNKKFCNNNIPSFSHYHILYLK